MKLLKNLVRRYREWKSEGEAERRMQRLQSIQVFIRKEIKAGRTFADLARYYGATAAFFPLDSEADFRDCGLGNWEGFMKRNSWYVARRLK